MHPMALGKNERPSHESLVAVLNPPVPVEDSKNLRSGIRLGFALDPLECLKNTSSPVDGVREVGVKPFRFARSKPKSLSLRQNRKEETQHKRENFFSDNARNERFFKIEGLSHPLGSLTPSPPPSGSARQSLAATPNSDPNSEKNLRFEKSPFALADRRTTKRIQKREHYSRYPSID